MEKLLVSRPRYLKEIASTLEVMPVCALIGPHHCGITTVARQFAGQYAAQYQRGNRLVILLTLAGFLLRLSAKERPSKTVPAKQDVEPHNGSLLFTAKVVSPQSLRVWLYPGKMKNTKYRIKKEFLQIASIKNEWMSE